MLANDCLEQIKWGKRTNPKCEQHYGIIWGTGLNKDLENKLQTNIDLSLFLHKDGM